MKKILACGLLCLLLSGCEALPYPRELEETMLVRVLGVDWTEAGVALTAADIPQEGDQEEAELLKVFAPTPEESQQKLKEAGEEYVALTHVTQILVGEDSDLRRVLEGALAGAEVGQTSTVWLVKTGTARDLMEAVNGGAKRLTSIELNVSGVTPRTVLEALAELEHEGTVSLPALTAKDGNLEPAGMVEWKEMKI